MSTRSAHRRALFGDLDVLHSGAVTAAACLFSGGLVYLGYLLHVLRVARSAPCRPEHGECVLLFGKHAPQGRIDRDFDARLDRAVSLWHALSPGTVVLLGGGCARRNRGAAAHRRRGGLYLLERHLHALGAVDRPRPHAGAGHLKSSSFAAKSAAGIGRPSQ